MSLQSSCRINPTVACRLSVWLAFTASLISMSLSARGQDKTTTKQESEKAPVKLKVADGAIELTASSEWVKVEPAFNMIEVEFKVPRVDADKEAADGRLTGMSSAGGVEQNLARWYAQFLQPDGSATSAAAKVEQFAVGKITAHLVDISGTYLDTGAAGPGGPKTERAGYRMLAAILETPKDGTFFLKFYGPEATVSKHEEAFKQMVRTAKLTN